LFTLDKSVRAYLKICSTVSKNLYVTGYLPASMITKRNICVTYGIIKNELFAKFFCNEKECFQSVFENILWLVYPMYNYLMKLAWLRIQRPSFRDDGYRYNLSWSWRSNV